LDFLYNMGYLKTDSIRLWPVKNKVTKFTLKGTSNDFRRFWIKSGISYFKFLNEHTEDIKDKITYKTHSFEENLSIDNFIEYLGEQSSINIGSKIELLDFLISKDVKFDHIKVTKLKETSIGEFEEIVVRLASRNAWDYLWFSHNFYNQLQHLTSLSTPPDTLSFF